MLTDNELSIYAANGALLRTVPHAYARPAMAAGNTRLCLYHRGGTSLTVESRSRTLWEYSAQNAIELCAMSPGGTLAIAQRLSLIHISEPTRQAEISYAVFCLKKKKKRHKNRRTRQRKL